MKQLVIAAFFTIATLAPGLAGAQTTPKPHELTAQQEKMKDCNAQAKEKHLKGAEHQTFMSQCLKGSAASAAQPHELTAQQQKMKDCSAQAKEKQLKGKDRKTFMSTCLKGS